MTPSSFIMFIYTLFNRLPKKKAILLILVIETIYIAIDHFIFDLSPTNNIDSFRREQLVLIDKVEDIHSVIINGTCRNTKPTH